ncbi:MAG: hypothetical protein ACI8ZO_001423 [Flavobacteriales bacterium]|jgi:hypothetical protein
MKAYSAKEIKKEIELQSPKDLRDIIAHLARFKKENKELLTYLLFVREDEEAYIQSIQENMDELFEQMNTSSYFFIKKTARKILTQIKKFVRYSKKKETEIELLLYYCNRLVDIEPSIFNSTALTNIFQRQMAMIVKNLDAVHEDLQYDYQNDLKDIRERVQHYIQP